MGRDTWLMATTPRPVIDSVLRSVCGRKVERLVRLTAGGLNETYRAELADETSVIVRIARRPLPWFVDEAHVMAGRATKAMKYSFGLDDSRIALERRLFLTATPRTYRSPTAAADARGESAVTSMDNTTAFGPVVYQMSHQQVCKW